MNCLELINELNRKQIMGEEISQNEREEAVSILLHHISTTNEINNYKKTMRTNEKTRDMYPDYFIPPYDGKKKYRLLQGYLPKTNILYANYYELEILRLLLLYVPYEEEVQEMMKHTNMRLRNTCFGNSCTQGECLATGISVLRFLSAMKKEHRDWMERILIPLGDTFALFGNGQAATQLGIPMSYLLLAFTEINNEYTRSCIDKKKDWLLDLLRRGWITGKLSNGRISVGDTYNLLGKYIIRNALATLPEFEGIKESRIYVNEKDGRCYCEC